MGHSKCTCTTHFGPGALVSNVANIITELPHIPKYIFFILSYSYGLKLASVMFTIFKERETS